MNRVVISLIVMMTWLFGNYEVAMAVPNPIESIYWTDSGGIFDGRYNVWPDRVEAHGGAQFNTIEDIEFAYNSGRRTEETQLGLLDGTYGMFDLPPAETWYALSPPEQALMIINWERSVRGIVPLEGFHPILNQLAADYATHLTDNNLQGHTDVNGRVYQERLNNDTLINNCYEIGGGENLAYYPTAAVSIPIELSIYQFIYTSPLQGGWSHRESMLTEMNESINSPDTEGYLGVGVSTDDDYLYGDYGGGTAAVFVLVDPLLRNHGNCPWPTSSQSTPLTVHLTHDRTTSHPTLLIVTVMSAVLCVSMVFNRLAQPCEG